MGTKIKLTADRRKGAVGVWHLEKENAPGDRSDFVVLDICNNHMADAYLTPSEARQLAVILTAAADEAERRN